MKIYQYSFASEVMIDNLTVLGNLILDVLDTLEDGLVLPVNRIGPLVLGVLVLDIQLGLHSLLLQCPKISDSLSYFMQDNDVIIRYGALVNVLEVLQHFLLLGLHGSQPVSYSLLVQGEGWPKNLEIAVNL